MAAPTPVKSVRRRLFVGALLTSVVAIALTAGSLFAYDLHRHRSEASADLATQAELLAYSTTAALEFNDAAVVRQSLEFLRARPTVRAAVIYDARGTVAGSYTRSDADPGSIPAGIGAEGVAVEGDRVKVFRRILSDGRPLGTVYLEQDLRMGERVASYSLIALLAMLFALAVTLLISSRVHAGITRPIMQVSDLARDVVARRDYSVRAQRTTDDEVGALADAFNEMLSEIQKRTAELESSNQEVVRLNKDLERRVGERTAQLEESNLQLRAASIAKSSFLSTMSHEIRTPMNGVLGMLELLALSDLDAQQRTTLAVVRDSGRSLLRIIDDILDFSKIEAGKLEVRPEPASIAKVVGNVVGIYSGNASSKALTLRSHVDPRISPAVMVDPVRLQQVLNNLVSNAIKFTSEGTVLISAELLGASDAADRIRFSVTDTGIGIAPEVQSRLFRPFEQASGDTARIFGGTGLGLSIAQRLAALMGGSIEIDSAPGRGTTISLELVLPAAPFGAVATAVEHRSPLEGALAGRAAPTVEEAEREGTLVLVVDDHPVNRLVLMRQVNALGYATETAKEGREALRLWRSGRFGLVLTDCNMPEMDGYELARAIRDAEARRGLPRTPIIACTANALRGEAQNCIAAGMDDYVSKPAELATLLAKLDRWLPLPAHGEPPLEMPDIHADEAVLDSSAMLATTGGDVTIEREILEEYLVANASDLASFEAALRDGDIDSFTQIAHRMKGAARTIGANAFARACARAEDAGKAGDWLRAVDAAPAVRENAARLGDHIAGLSMSRGMAIRT
ncbi:MAG TPA: ATP-binding protein [Usitatibacter sp.]|nr:ATP-binding protein [Usitatibacter sp.]